MECREKRCTVLRHLERCDTVLLEMQTRNAASETMKAIDRINTAAVQPMNIKLKTEYLCTLTEVL
jgi:hypothetical protein